MIDEEFLKKLKNTGCYLLSFGAESGCPRILKKIKNNFKSVYSYVTSEFI